MTNTLTRSLGRSCRAGQLALLVAMAVLTTVAMCGTASADFKFESAGVELNEPPLFEDKSLNPDVPEYVPIVKSDGTFVDPAFNRQAGSHPDLSVSFAVDAGPGGPSETPRDVFVDLPPGFVGNPTGVPACPPEDLAGGQAGPSCDVSTQVGVAEVIAWASGGRTPLLVAVFNIAHGPNVPARFGFSFDGVVSMITAKVDPKDYSISSGSFSISQAEALESVRLTLWGVPGDPSHDTLRQDHHAWIESPTFNAPQVPFYWQSVDNKQPFLTMPTSCSDTPVPFTFRGDSWEQQGSWDERTLLADVNGTPFTVEGCEKLPFNPSAVARPTSREPDAPSGVNVDIHVPQPQDPYGVAEAHVRKVKMTFPKGMSISPASAKGLDACPQASVGLGSNDPPSCPESSKLGTVEVDTPLLEDPLEGDVILAKQNDNPFNSLLALYIVAKGPGFYLKLPGRIDLDPETGQVTTTFDNNPQLPFEDLHLSLRGGPRAALVTPPTCGDYSAQMEFVSWASSTPVTESIPMKFDQGCGSGGFNPSLRAGTASPRAGAFAPFNMQIVRAGGDQNLSRIEATLPEGLLAKLAGVPLCGDAQAATGECPPASQVGQVTVGAGAGPLPIYVPEAGKAPTATYLAGPYKGAPYSLVVKVPAQAGPFDLGTVAVRNGLYIDPTTTQATAKSDPLPQILQGIPISYRDVRVEVTRPDFTINPTSCRQMAVTSVLTSATGQTATPSSPFRVAGCKELGFKPKLAVSFSGAPTHRGGHPALKAVLTMPKGGANIGSAQVTLPKTEFLENAHIRTICTRVQYAANQCPKGSIYGFAKAWTPLLDKPLEGPVYLRSSNHTLPDLVASLDGQIHVDLDGRISSANKRLRTTFDFVPDAPVSKFVLQMQGGQKSLIVNNEELCKTKPRAAATFTGQNEVRSVSHPLVKVACGGKKK